MLERKHKLESEVKQLETTKRNWMTEVEITTKEMERLIQDQQRQQMEVVVILLNLGRLTLIVFRICKFTIKQTTN